jgi:hypothetical protein
LVKTTTLLVILAGLGSTSPAQTLFAPARADRVIDPASRPWVVRERAVRARLARIPGATARDAARGVLPPGGHRLVLNLFDDAVVRARMTSSERKGKAFVWVGKIEGQPLGDVVLTVYDGVLTGSVTGPEGAYRITVERGVTVVQELDDSRFPEDHCFEEVPPGTLDSSAEPVPQGDDGSLVDVLVVYTPAARAAAGSTPAMLSLVNTAIAETNVGYANSNVVQRLRLVAAAEISYAETDISTDLGRVTGTTDGYMDNVHALRDSSKADEVVLIGEGYATGQGACGVAWLMAGNNPGFAPNAFAVVDRTCATGYYSFGHELGHNMGLNHARQDPVGTGAYAYSYGYKWTGYRTVMAYSPGTRILYFSNPGVLYLGSPTGVSEALPTSANNALSLNNTRVTVANWRVNLNPTVTLTSPNGGQSWPTGALRSITWTSADLPVGAKVRVTYDDGSGRGYRTSRPAGGAIATVPAAGGSYSWTVPSTPGSSWRVRLCVLGAPIARGAASACLASDASDAPFTITP